LHGALQALELAGQPVSRIVPEFWPDDLTDRVQVLGEPAQARLVFTAQGGVSVWPLSAASVALLNWPQTAEVVAEPALAALTEQLFQRPVRLAQAAQRALHGLQSPWDLAQFELVNSSRSRTVKRWLGSWREFAKARRWRAARISVWALVGANLLGLNAWAWQEKARLNAQRQAIRAVLTDTFPSVRVVVDAPIQMAREVAALQHASGMPSGRDLERMLGAFAEVAPAGSAPVMLDFVPGELRLTGLALTPEALASVTFKLKPLAYDAALTGDSLLIKQGAQP
jgi:general secretion pathway protein L